MAETPLSEEAPGEYIPYGRRPYYSPDPLPPDASFELDSEFHQLLRDTVLQLGQLKGIGQETRTNPLLYTVMVRREAVESVVLEGADTDLEQVFRTQEIDHGQTVKKDVQEALNYERTIEQGAEAIADGRAISIELLQELHASLMEGARGHCEHPGAFRNGPMNLPPAGSFQEPFVPPASDKVPGLMENLIDFITTDQSIDDLLAIAIAHYQFETIHPFEDGNGRLGRILITLQMIDKGYLSRPYLYPSAYFNRHKVQYAERMRAVSEYGEWLPWLRFFIEGIRSQAAEAEERTRELQRLQREYERQYGREQTAADRLAMRLFEQPYVMTTDVEELLGVSQPTARRAIAELEAEGILEETTGKDRYQEFKAVDIFDVLDRPLTSTES
ncbi:Fic family protein [Halosegnis marinus]|uniref:Fic family protein n=1 Tax=Halosegnis marinus TaxID=3034023 RepID=A0ABD5ZT35_9EURY|nr:Fic family protein [Halosegnis sp. DT85]